VADTETEATAFVERYGWTWPSIRDAERDRARALGATYQPHFVLVDTEGRIADSWEGGGDEDVWERMVARLP
jgi:hypothetical protein